MTSVIKVCQLMALNMFVDELIVMISDQKKILVNKNSEDLRSSGFMGFRT